MVLGIKGFPMDVATMVRSRDLGVAEKVVSDIIDPRRFRYPGGARPSEVRISHLAMKVGHLFGVRHGVPIEVTSEPIRSYQVMVPLRGWLRADGEEAQPGHALIYSPQDRMNTMWSGDCLALVLSLPQANFQDFLRQALPEGDWALPPRFAPLVSLASGGARSFANVLKVICHECLNEDSALRQGLTIRSLEEAMLLSLSTMLGDGHPHPRHAACPRRNAAIARAVDFITAHCDEDIAISDLVKVAGASSRTLQTGFLERYGVGPMTFLKQTRLRCVHEALRAARHGCDSVGDIAARWGFYNGSAFAKAYRQMFGQLPSETLAGKPCIRRQLPAGGRPAAQAAADTPAPTLLHLPSPPIPARHGRR